MGLLCLSFEIFSLFRIEPHASELKDFLCNQQQFAQVPTDELVGQVPEGQH